MLCVCVCGLDSPALVWQCGGEATAARKEMEKDRRRRQTPSVHPGSRKPLISMEGAGLDGWIEGRREGGRGQKWILAGVEDCLCD